MTNRIFLILLLTICESCTSTKPSSSSTASPTSTTTKVCGFERAPFVAKVNFKNGSTTDGSTVFVGLHAKPDKVYFELNMLDDVMREVILSESVTSAIALGDFNADCSYLSNTDEANLDLTSSEFDWFIPSTADTNVASSSCAYDRIIYSGSGLTNLGSGVQTTNIDSSISDHYLVYSNVEASGNTYKIAAFNIQRYGPSKQSKTDFVTTLKSIISQYDIILLQEITSVDTTVINTLIPTGYSYKISERLGSTSYKEQYVYVYNNKIEIPNSYVYQGELCANKTSSSPHRPQGL